MIAETVYRELIRDFGSPLYVYDGDGIVANARATIKDLHGFEVLYSAKANPAPAICNLLIREGIGIAVASSTELRFSEGGAFCRGLPTLFEGPGKETNEIEYAVVNDIPISLESLSEIRAVQAIARRLDIRPRVLLRVNAAHAPKDAGEMMAGGPSQFGIDEENVVAIWKSARAKNLDLLGIHVHVASQVLDGAALIAHYTRTTHMAIDIMRSIGLPLRTINFGGGIGTPLGKMDQRIDIDKLGCEAITAIRNVLGCGAAQVSCQLELGRYLIGPFGAFICTVRDVKTSRGRVYVVVDAGFAGFARPVMPWAQQHSCRALVGDLPGRTRALATVVGRSCLPADVLAKEAFLPPVERGDLLLVADAGAYGLTMTPILFGTHKAPSEILLLNGQSVALADYRNIVASCWRTAPQTAVAPTPSISH